MGILFCAVAFVVTLFAARRSLVAGLSALCAVGYFYGILRGNFPDAASTFVFDSAVLAFYLMRLFAPQTSEARMRTQSILPWLILMTAWPALLVFIPLQEPLVQLVGLRANVFLLPFLLIGARLTRDEMHRLAVTIAVLNLAAFCVTGAEYAIGVQHFFPRNANTELIYRSADVAGSQFRIPSIFSGSHAYAGTMVMSLPLLLGAWAAGGVAIGKRLLLTAAIVATVLGVFAAAARMHLIVLALVVAATLVSGRIHIHARMAVVAAMALIGVVVLSQARLQRFTTLSDSSYVSTRVGGSVNANFFELVVDYPFGNGLGGGGASMPAFLEGRVRNRVVMENEYARILLEQTCIGLCLWIAFLLWFVSRRFASTARYWDLTLQLCWVAVVGYFCTAVLGIGLMTSIPQTMLLLICAGAASAWQGEEYAVAAELQAGYARVA